MLSAFARSFLIQGSWNYHTMLGSGFAFAMLPILRRLHGTDPDAMDAALRRHLEHFNAHPYLSDVALGAAMRLEADGEDPETIRRFKTAVRSPLGSLGDALVWASWLPAVSLAALGMLWLGAPGWVAVAAFLTAYNAGHLGLRAWGFRAGLREGRAVGGTIKGAHLDRITERVRGAAAVLLGAVAGAVLMAGDGLAAAGWTWGVVGAAAFGVGARMGQRAWRPAAVAVVATVGILAIWGITR
ncbi:MAG: PTS system mannose/fructose/sorbose family transporter subunit IID [Longimicrobiales bacterium]